jgi:hypothetical protein
LVVLKYWPSLLPKVRFSRILKRKANMHKYVNYTKDTAILTIENYKTNNIKGFRQINEENVMFLI